MPCLIPRLNVDSLIPNTFRTVDCLTKPSDGNKIIRHAASPYI